MTNTARIQEIHTEIARLRAELLTLNPYAGLNELSNKEFGEKWSESWIVEHCPNFIREDKKGYDLYSERLGRVEVKSTRIPNKGITFNQVHPYDCDYLLLAIYDTHNGGETLYLVPIKAIFDKEIKVNNQHGRTIIGEIPECGTITDTKANMAVLNSKYRINSWEELNGKA